MKRLKPFTMSVYLSLFVLFCHWIVNGPNGVYVYFEMKKNITKERGALKKVTDQLTRIKHAYRYYQDPIAQEQIIRCDLCMGYTNELIYLMPSKHMATSIT